MDGVEIITKEVIKKSNDLIVWIFGVILISIVLATLIYFLKTLNEIVVIRILKFLGIIGPLLLIVIIVLSSTVFTLPTDKYKYTARIDESVSLVEFYDSYTNIEYKDGIWYFEDKE